MATNSPIEIDFVANRENCLNHYKQESHELVNCCHSTSPHCEAPVL